MLALAAGLGVFLTARFGWRTALLIGGFLAAGRRLFLGRPQTALSTGEGTGQERIEIWSDGMMLMREAPLFGVGKDKFDDASATSPTIPICNVLWNWASSAACSFWALLPGGRQAFPHGESAQTCLSRPGNMPAFILIFRRRRQLRRRHVVADALLHLADLHCVGAGDGVRAHGPAESAAAGRRASTSGCWSDCLSVAVVGFGVLYVFVRLFVIH